MTIRKIITSVDAVKYPSLEARNQKDAPHEAYVTVFIGPGDKLCVSLSLSLSLSLCVCVCVCMYARARVRSQRLWQRNIHVKYGADMWGLFKYLLLF